MILGADHYIAITKAVQRGYVASGTKEYQEARDELEQAVEAINVWRDELAAALDEQQRRERSKLTPPEDRR